MASSTEELEDQDSAVITNPSVDDSEVLKPPGGGSSDIFGSNGGGPEQMTPEPRRNKAHQSSNLFLGDETDNHSTSSNSKASSASVSSNKPGNDSYQRLFGEFELPKTPSVKNRMKSNIVLEQIDSTATNNTNNYNHFNNGNAVIGNGINNNHNNNFLSVTNGNSSSNTIISSSSSTSVNTTPRSQTPRSHPSTPNGNRSPREGSGKASLYTPRNPVTGDGYGFVPVRQCYSSRRKDGNPVTGEGYENAKPQSSHLSNGGSVSSQSSVAPTNGNGNAGAPRQRVPPGGFSSGLW